MLGLLKHDPHFCLLREEVKFGLEEEMRECGVRNTSPPAMLFRLAYIRLFSLESINFDLLHLSLMRKYLDLEFWDIEPRLPFNYNLELVINDFILLAVFIGNDFLPNLHDLHIYENELEQLFYMYKEILPSLGTLFQASF